MTNEKQDHGEPWVKVPTKFRSGNINSEEWHDVVSRDGKSIMVGCNNNFNSDRIMACVNACEGTPTEDLLIIAGGHMIACKHCGHEYRVPFEN